MKILGISMLLLGLLAVGGGILVAIVSQVLPNDECVLADKFKSEADQLSRDADSTRGTAKESELRAKALEKMKSAQTWAEGCSDRRRLHYIALGGGLIVAAVGFVLSIAGCFVFVRGRRKV